MNLFSLLIGRHRRLKGPTRYALDAEETEGLNMGSFMLETGDNAPTLSKDGRSIRAASEAPKNGYHRNSLNGEIAFVASKTCRCVCKDQNSSQKRLVESQTHVDSKSTANSSSNFISAEMFHEAKEIIEMVKCGDEKTSNGKTNIKTEESPAENVDLLMDNSSICSDFESIEQKPLHLKYSFSRENSLESQYVALDGYHCDPCCKSLPQRRKIRTGFYSEFNNISAAPMSIIGILILILYLLLGMVIFHTVEQQGAVRVTSENDFLLFDFIQEWLERTYNAEFSNVTEFLAGALKQLRHNSTELEKYWESKLGKETIWTWPNALFYSFTVVTTIGYGNIVPTTSLGKTITIIYGIVGVPLFFSVVSYWGEIVHQLLVKFEKLLLLRSKTVAKSIPTQSRKIIVIIIFLLIFYGLFVFVAATLIDTFRQDEMGFVTSLYFCYITISSIGFGDYSLLTYDDTLATWLSYFSFMLYVFLSAVGLAGVVIFRVYSCTDNYVLLADEIS